VIVNCDGTPQSRTGSVAGNSPTPNITDICWRQAVCAFGRLSFRGRLSHRIRIGPGAGCGGFAAVNRGGFAGGGAFGQSFASRGFGGHGHFANGRHFRNFGHGYGGWGYPGNLSDYSYGDDCLVSTPYGYLYSCNYAY
jgi:hypothetical protein